MMAEHLQIGPRKVDLTGMLCIRPATLLASCVLHQETQDHIVINASFTRPIGPRIGIRQMTPSNCMPEASLSQEASASDLIASRLFPPNQAHRLPSIAKGLG